VFTAAGLFCRVSHKDRRLWLDVYLVLVYQVASRLFTWFHTWPTFPSIPVIVAVAALVAVAVVGRMVDSLNTFDGCVCTHVLLGSSELLSGMPCMMTVSFMACLTATNRMNWNLEALLWVWRCLSYLSFCQLKALRCRDRSFSGVMTAELSSSRVVCTLQW
jgi:hypothetical protein